MKVLIRTWENGKIIDESTEYGVSKKEVAEIQTYNEENGVGNGINVFILDQRPQQNRERR